MLLNVHQRFSTPGSVPVALVVACQSHLNSALNGFDRRQKWTQGLRFLRPTELPANRPLAGRVQLPDRHLDGPPPGTPGRVLHMPESRAIRLVERTFLNSPRPRHQGSAES